MNNTAVLMSGGLDSTVLAAYLKSLGHQVRCLGIDYGQRHRCELDAAVNVANALDVPYERLDLSLLRRVLAQGSQTGDTPVPDGHYADESMKVTVVPNRNMILLSVAAGYAITRQCNAIAYAAHAGDHTIYPDCRPEFVAACEAVLWLCDWNPVLLHAPFLKQTKAEIVGIGARIAAPMHLTWSCYKGGEQHCGKCGTCVERREAFQLAGIYDPTDYEA
jgi:7-cyano-7-deazaguanine synthase